MQALSLRLPDEIAERLNRLAHKTGRTKTFYIQQAVIEHLDSIEDIYLAEKRLEEIEAGKAKAVSLEELMKHYGVEG